MLIAITVTGKDAKSLSYILGKHPDHVFIREFSAGNMTVSFPEYSDERATAALLIQVDTIGMVRGEWKGVSASYIDPRPYVSSSLTSVALKEAYRSSFTTKSKEPAVAAMMERELPISVEFSSLWCKIGEEGIRTLFEPLGYSVACRELPFASDWLEGERSALFNATLTGKQTIAALLNHLYVLLPVIGKGKHYFVEEAEVAKLLQHGAGWLENHPAKERIVSRYLVHRRSLIEEALEQLAGEESDDPAEENARESEFERPIRLQEERLQTAMAVLKTLDPPPLRIGDLGCGTGDFMRIIMDERMPAEVVGMDVSSRSIQIAEKKLRIATRPEWQRPKVSLLHGSLVYTDLRLKELDTLVLLEVIEHVDPPKLPIIEHNIFEYLKPCHVMISTPNKEYNPLFPNMEKDRFRHDDHRFEWTREEFRRWTSAIIEKYPYTVEIYPVGKQDEQAGPPTQMAVFRRKDIANVGG